MVPINGDKDHNLATPRDEVGVYPQLQVSLMFSHKGPNSYDQRSKYIDRYTSNCVQISYRSHQ